MIKPLLTSAETIIKAAQLCQVSLNAFDFPFESENIFSDFSKAISSSIGSTICEKRTLIAGSFRFDKLRETSMLRVPLVAAFHDQNFSDISNANWLMFFPSTNSEIMSSITMAYRLSEDSKVLLPSAVNIEYYCFREPTELLSKQAIGKLLSPLKSSKITSEISQSMDSALKIASKLDLSMEKHMTEDADVIIVSTGFNAITIKQAVNVLRSQGEKVGLLRIKMFPFPHEEIENTLLHSTRIVVIDSPGLAREISQFGRVFSYIPKGRLSENQVKEIYQHAKKADKPRKYYKPFCGIK